ncbi:hypothetical protein CDD81_4834 [Ophiocordyceps australis]|uniref:Acyltransferase MbtK/IucB-like conserved domain-containing protein n=1 Tax=Ophiocordyceps australis TaxID=1399860 RepID=A0A2C5Y9T9_9HYPO|nr:hypothetical protein CDD81_4834 [Ophiocordyceps australis]
MPPQTLHLPDGQTFTVAPVFGGVSFRSHELQAHDAHPFPFGWTTVLHTRSATHDAASFTQPTRSRDSLFVSSISIPSDADFSPAASPSRQAAMMLWVTLYWYFHQPEPSAADAPSALAPAAANTPPEARPLDDWRIAVLPRGLLAGKNLLAKLEHMGLVAVDDSSVLAAADACALHTDDAPPFASVHVSRRSFWQLPGRLFLYTLEPANSLSNRYASSLALPSPLSPRFSSHAAPFPPQGPFFSTSHLPTYFPPRPLEYVVSPQFHVRHPSRPKPPPMGHVFYSRYVPSVGHYLALRVASSEPRPVPYRGPLGPDADKLHAQHPRLAAAMSDVDLLRSWHAVPRVARFWGDFDAASLPRALRLAHSFPVIGLWDGVPFGYFEIYWAKEDLLGRVAGSEVTDWDRGIHVMIGEEWARNRVPAWLTSLVHWCFNHDLRTMNIVLEPRIDNARMLRHLDSLGFSREKQVCFPHKQSWYVRLRREAWDGPAL